MKFIPWITSSNHLYYSDSLHCYSDIIYKIMEINNQYFFNRLIGVSLSEPRSVNIIRSWRSVSFFFCIYIAFNQLPMNYFRHKVKQPQACPHNGQQYQTLYLNSRLLIHTSNNHNLNTSVLDNLIWHTIQWLAKRASYLALPGFLFGPVAQLIMIALSPTALTLC